MLKSISIVILSLLAYSTVMFVIAADIGSDIPIGIWGMSLVAYGMYGMVAYFADDQDDLFTTAGMTIGLMLIAGVVAAGIFS